MFSLSGLTPELLRACAWIFLFGLWICSRDIPLRWALPVVAIKVAIPLLYFAHDGFGAIHLSDDLEYYYDALVLYQQGLTVGLFLAAPGSLSLFVDAVGSQHVVYPFWNLAAFSMFGPYYFSPVLLNVGATFAAGWFFARVLGRMGFEPGYRMAALVFFLLHWEVVVWSSLLNLKDNLVMVLTLATLHAFILLFERPRLVLFLWGILLLAGLAYLRFYAPLLVGAAVFLHLLRERGAGGRAATLLILLIGIGGLFLGILEPAIKAASWLQPQTLLWGLPRFFLTPLPWNLTESSAYLFIPSLLHLLLILPALAAVPFLWARGGAARFLLVYGAVIMLLYSVTPDLQGVRHRAQIAFLFAWLQFHALWMLFHYAAAAGRGQVPSPQLVDSKPG